MVSVVDIHRYAEPVLSSAELETLEIADRGSELRIIITTQGCHGKPYLEIINYADEIDADLIVLGYHGHSHAGWEQRGVEPKTPTGCRRQTTGHGPMKGALT